MSYLPLSNLLGKKMKEKIMGSISTIKIILLFSFLLLASTFYKSPSLLTGLEKTGYFRLTRSVEVSEFLNALLISKEISLFKNGHSSPDKMTVVLIDAQHGMEPSGTEALLIVARDIVEKSPALFLTI